MHAFVAALVLFAAALPARAQFQSSGEATVRAGEKWYEMGTGHFRIIFPESYAGSAPAYANALEKAWKPVSSSIGISPNELYSKKMPVVLHTRTSYSNGFVTWTPHRMELLTTPDAYGHGSLLNADELAVHELRHVSQMQMGRFPHYKPFHWLFGELFDGAMAGLYGGPALFEGDAVTAETALTGAGRGRTADFLEYWRVSLADGDWRNWWQWRWGSQRRYTPDHYRAGYVAVAGMRSVYDCPDFTARYYGRIRDGFFPFFNFQRTVRDVSGKPLRETFREIEDSLAAAWKSNDAQRAPFMPSEAVTAPTRMYSDIRDGVMYGGSIYAVRSGMDRSTELVRISGNGKIERLRAFSSMAGKLAVSSSGRLVWSEHKPDVRRGLKSSSVIRYLEGNGGSRTLAGGHRYYNPCFSPDGDRIAVTEYPTGGGSRIVILDSGDGRVLDSLDNASGLEILEPVWTSGGLFFSAVTSGGTGIFRADGSAIITPLNVKVKQLRADNDKISFVCDISGVNELYSLDPADGKLLQLTNSRFGAESYIFNGSRDTLYYSALSRDGRTIRRTPVAELPVKEAEWLRPAEHPFAEELSGGDASLAENDDFNAEYGISPYRRGAHFLHFHSWAPLCIQVDDIAAMSYDKLVQMAGLGATAFFQNELGTTSGYAALSWPLGAHLSLKYSGWFPVIEAKLDVAKEVSGSLSAYLPLDFSGGGVSRGFIPKLTISASNGRFDDKPDVPLNRITASLRAYASLPVPASCIYPRWGIGAETAVSFRAGLADRIRPNACLYAYGYIPGLMRTHGIRLSATAQKSFGKAEYVETFASTAPRGAASINPDICSRYGNQLLLSADYALPFAPVDLALGPVAYLRNFELTLHYDQGLYSGAAGSASISSAGATLCARLANLLWIPYDTRIGVEWYYNNGALIKERQSWNLVFSIDF